MPDIKIVGQIYLITAGCNSGHSLWWTDYQPIGHQVAYPRWSSASPSQPVIIKEVMQYSPPPGLSLGTQCINATWHVRTKTILAQFNMLSSPQFLRPQSPSLQDNLTIWVPKKGLTIKLLV